MKHVDRNEQVDTTCRLHEHHNGKLEIFVLTFG